MVRSSHRFMGSLSVVAMLVLADAASAQVVDESFRTDIEKLLEVTGSKQLGIQMASLVGRQVFDGLRQSQPDIPARAIEVVQGVLDEEFAKAFTGPDSMTPGLVAVYAKHFTQAEVRGLLAFYGTDLGRKVVKTLPIIVQESAAVSQAWSAQHMPAIMSNLERRLRAEGFLK